MYRFKIPDRFAPSPPHVCPTSGVGCCYPTSARRLAPCRWTEYAPFGETISDTRIIAVKTPLEKVSLPASCGAARTSSRSR